MKVIQIINDCEISKGMSSIRFKGGEFYIVSDDLKKRLEIVLGYNIGIEIPFKEIYNQYKGEDLNNRKLLALRHGGGGDILFMLTALAEVKRKYKNSKLNIAINPQYHAIPENNPTIDKILSLPISLTEWNEFHYHIIFENLIENNPLAMEYNAYDLFMLQFGLDIKKIPPENKIPKLYITPEERINIKEKFSSLCKDYNQKMIGIQAEASSPVRKYPPYNFVKIGKTLIKKGYDIYFFGNEIQKNTINYLVKEIGEGSFKVITDLRTAIIVSSFMDYFIAPDSMFVHIAGALEIPVVGIYGPFHSDLRMKYFNKSIGINAKTNCSPCFKHGHHPCEKGNPSPCFSLISSDIVIKAFEELEKGE